jgi:Tol biopolymer transport system component/DNA-binding winged helix-turn-helix (wHTH) protein
LKLQPQPFRVLLLLIEHAGQVVKREEIQQCLWTDSTFVDFEHGINFSINQIRVALADNAEKPSYIETLPKRGYRFIGALERSPVPKQPEARKPERFGRVVTALKRRPGSSDFLARNRGQAVAALLAAFAAAFAGGVYFLAHRASPMGEIKQRRLTANPSGMPVDRAVISPDGKYLAYSDQIGIHLKLLGANESHTLEAPPGFSPGRDGLSPAAWFPNSARLLVNAAQAGQRSVWVTSILGGTPQKLRDNVTGQSVSPDGSLIAFTADVTRIGDREVWLMAADGESAHKLVTVDERSGIGRVAWSPEGQRIAYQKFHWEADKTEISIESCNLKGTQCVVVLSDPELIDFCWGLQGRLIYSRYEPQPNGNDSNLWEVRSDPRTANRSDEPRRLTNWAGFSFLGLTESSDGQRLAFMKSSVETDVYVGQLERDGTGLKVPRRLTLDDHNDWPLGWTPDSKAVLFQSDRNGAIGIFKQALDRDSAEAISTGPGDALCPTLSPDGFWILYAVTPKLEGISPAVRLMRVPLLGGAPQEILEAKGYHQHDCARLPATLCAFAEQADERDVVFWAFDPIKGKGRELTRLPVSPSEPFDWALAPDGLQIAAVKPHDPEGHIRILSLAGRSERDVAVKGWGVFINVNWEADGKGFFVSGQSPRVASLLHVSLDGRSQVLWEQNGSWNAYGVASPDGRYLAFRGSTSDSNVWIVENF